MNLAIIDLEYKFDNPCLVHLNTYFYFYSWTKCCSSEIFSYGPWDHHIFFSSREPGCSSKRHSVRSHFRLVSCQTRAGNL